MGPLFHPLVCSVRKPIFQPLREAEPRPKEEGGRFPVAFGRFASINAPNAAGPCCPGFDSCNSPVSLTFREDKKRVQVTYAALHERVARLAKAVRDLGIKPGDRVAAYMPNMIETAAATLAAGYVKTTPVVGLAGFLG